MKITVFTSNQPRHFSFLQRLCDHAQVTGVVECSTLLPGLSPGYYKTSPVMAEYFGHVLAAEKAVFGEIAFPSPEVRLLPLELGDLSSMPLTALAPALDADVYIVFGSSWIKGALVDYLISKRAINIHIGVSPFYRGSSCNFWALYDGRPDRVGATIHLLSKGLDSGPILFHALPAPAPWNAFELGMRAVEAAQAGLCDKIAAGTLFDLAPRAQDRSSEVRYTRGNAFTDEIAAKYLSEMPKPEVIAQKLRARDLRDFIAPWSPPTP